MSFDSRQTEHRSNLPRISDQAKPTLKQVLPQIDKELTPIFELRESSTPDLILNVGASKITNSDTGLTKTLSPISQQFFDFASGTITFPAATGGAITVSPGSNGTLTVASGNFIAVLIQIDSTGSMSVVTGTEAASAVLAANAANFPVHNSAALPIGYVVMENLAGTIQSVINENVVQFESGGTSSGGSGGVTSVVTKVADYTLTTFDKTVLVDTSGGDVTLTLPPAAGNSGLEYFIKKIGSDILRLTIDGDGADLIENNATLQLVDENEHVHIVSDGTAWQVIGKDIGLGSVRKVRVANGYGSTNTMIRRYDVGDITTGGSVVFSDSGSLGGFFTVIVAGVYSLSMTEESSVVDALFGWSLNSSEGTININNIVNKADRLTQAAVATGAGRTVNSSWTGTLAAGDVVRVHTSGAASNDVTMSTATVARVG